MREMANKYFIMSMDLWSRKHITKMIKEMVLRRFNDFGTKLSTQNYKDGLRHGVNEGLFYLKVLMNHIKRTVNTKETFKRYYKEDKLLWTRNNRKLLSKFKDNSKL